jgi:hypothetical protein
VFGWGGKQKFLEKNQACATLNSMIAPVLPKDKEDAPPKPFTGIKRPEVKALRPNQMNVVELFKRVRGQ